MPIETVIDQEPPKIIFLNYQISKEANDVKNMTLIGKKIVDGKLKIKLNNTFKTGDVGDLLCIQLNSDSVAIASEIIKNPFIKTFEYLNDSLTFQTKTVTLEKAYVNLRLQLHSKTTHIAIKEVIDSLQNYKPLIVNTIEK